MYKKIISLITLIAPLFFFSCTSDSIEDFEYMNLNEQFMTRSSFDTNIQHPLLAGRFIEYVDNQYVITISEEDAAKIGVPKEEYDEITESIRRGNEMLKELIDSCNNSGCKLTISTSMYDENTVDDFVPILRTTEEITDFPTGRIETNGQESGYSTIDKLPVNMRSVDCHCFSRAALLPMQIVTTSSLGSKQVASGVGPVVKLNVSFAATNVLGSIEYRTSDSNGGICSWKGSSYNPNVTPSN